MEIWRLKNTDTRIVFPICDADGDPTSHADDNTPDSEWLSWDTADHGGGAPSFSDCTHEYAEIAGGFYYLDVQAAEINKDFTLLQMKTALAGCKTQAILIRTYINSNEDLHGHLATIDGHITADYGATEKSCIDLLDDAAGGLADIHTDVAAIKTETALIVADTGELQVDNVDGGRTDLLVDSIITKLGTPVAVDSGTASVAGMLLKMIDDNGGASFDATLSSLNALRSTVAAGVPVNLASTANAQVNAGMLISGTYANTDLDNGSYYVTAPINPGGLDVNLTFALGNKRPNIVTINGKYNAATNKYVDVYAYNYQTAAYDKLSDAATRMNHSTSDLNYQYNLLNAHASVSGEAKIRFVSTDTDTGYRLSIDQCLIKAVEASATASEIADAVYNKMKFNVHGGGIWIDTVSGGHGQVVGVNGIASNPCHDLADAVALAALVGVKKYYLAVGSSIQLLSAHVGWNFVGKATIDLNGQDTTGSLFEEGIVTGDADNKASDFHDCEITAVTDLVGGFHDCELKGAIALGTGTSYFNGCFSRGPSPGFAPTITMGALTTYVGFRMYSGKLTIADLTDDQIVSFDSPAGELILDASCDGGEVRRRGVHDVTGAPAGVTITNNAVTPADVLAIKEKTDMQPAVWYTP